MLINREQVEKTLRWQELSRIGKVLYYVGAIRYGKAPGFWMRKRWWHPVWVVLTPIFLIAVMLVSGVKGVIDFLQYYFKMEV